MSEPSEPPQSNEVANSTSENHSSDDLDDTFYTSKSRGSEPGDDLDESEYTKETQKLASEILEQPTEDLVKTSGTVKETGSKLIDTEERTNLNNAQNKSREEIQESKSTNGDKQKEENFKEGRKAPSNEVNLSTVQPRGLEGEKPKPSSSPILAEQEKTDVKSSAEKLGEKSESDKQDIPSKSKNFTPDNTFLFQLHGTVAKPDLPEDTIYTITFATFSSKTNLDGKFSLSFPFALGALESEEKIIKIISDSDDPKSELTGNIVMKNEISKLIDEIQSEEEFPVERNIEGPCPLMDINGGYNGVVNVDLSLTCLGLITEKTAKHRRQTGKKEAQESIKSRSPKADDQKVREKIEKTIKEPKTSKKTPEERPSPEELKSRSSTPLSSSTRIESKDSGDSDYKEEEYDDYTATINGHSLHVKVLKPSKKRRPRQGPDFAGKVEQKDNQMVFGLPSGRTLCKEGERKYNVKTCKNDQHGHGTEAFTWRPGASRVKEEEVDRFAIVIGRRHPDGKGRLELKLQAPKPITAEDFKKPTRDAGNQTDVKVTTKQATLKTKKKI